MSTSFKVSVLLTSYNKDPLIGEAIQSVLSQTMPDFELLICDDFSTDNSLSIIEGFREKDARIKVIPSLLCVDHSDCGARNRYTYNINTMLELAVGEYITYLCDDDLYKPHRLERMVSFLEAHPEAYIVYGKQETQQLSSDLRIISSGERGTAGVCWRAFCTVDHSSFMHRRECLDILWKEWGGRAWVEDPRFWRIGDAKFFERLNRYWAFYPIEEVLDVHRYNRLSVSDFLDGNNDKYPVGIKYEEYADN